MELPKNLKYFRLVKTTWDLRTSCSSSKTLKKIICIADDERLNSQSWFDVLPEPIVLKIEKDRLASQGESSDLYGIPDSLVVALTFNHEVRAKEAFNRPQPSWVIDALLLPLDQLPMVHRIKRYH